MLARSSIRSNQQFGFRPGAAHANPNDAIPEASNLPPYGDPINIETAKKVAAAAVAESKKRNWNTMCVAVVDPHGELVYFERLDNCQYGSISISQHKARTAARYRRPTLVFENLLGKGDNFKYLTTLDDMLARSSSTARSLALSAPAAAPAHKITSYRRPA